MKKLIDIGDVSSITKLSVTSIHTSRFRGKFPQAEAVKKGRGGALLWDEAVIKKWRDDKMSENSDPKTRFLTLRVDEKVIGELKSISKKNKSNLSETVRGILEDYLVKDN